MTGRYFKPITSIAKSNGPAKLKPPPKPKLAQTQDPYWLSFAYRLCPGPSDKEVQNIVNLFFRLKADYPAITLPEACFWYECDKHQTAFTYQQDFNGGRAQLGGGVPDFWLPQERIIILIQGLYWHERPEVKERDAVLIAQMKRGTVDGAPINGVVQVADERIQSCQRSEIFKLALAGIENYP